MFHLEFRILTQPAVPRAGLHGISHLYAKIASILKVVAKTSGKYVQGGNYFRNLMPFEQIDNVFRDRSIQNGYHRFG